MCQNIRIVFGNNAFEYLSGLYVRVESARGHNTNIRYIQKCVLPASHHSRSIQSEGKSMLGQ